MEPAWRQTEAEAESRLCQAEQSSKQMRTARRRTPARRLDPTPNEDGDEDDDDDDDEVEAAETHCQMNYPSAEKAGTEMCLTQAGKFEDILSIHLRPGADVGGRAEGQPRSWAAEEAETAKREKRTRSTGTTATDHLH